MAQQHWQYEQQMSAQQATPPRNNATLPGNNTRIKQTAWTKSARYQDPRVSYAVSDAQMMPRITTHHPPHPSGVGELRDNFSVETSPIIHFPLLLLSGVRPASNCLLAKKKSFHRHPKKNTREGQRTNLKRVQEHKQQQQQQQQQQ
jgi:hypothetical protein